MLRRLALLASLLVLAPAGAQEVVNFRQEVMAVLSRGGCNQGTCHGNLNGKGGLKLSLRGEDPDKDYLTLTREQFGRRLNLQSPDDSLLLLKATGRTLHEGGPRFSTSSYEYRLLRDWIRQGMKDETPATKLVKLVVTPTERFVEVGKEPAQVSAWAHFANGSKKDITPLTVFESSNPRNEVTRTGRIDNSAAGEATIVARYLHLQETSVWAFLAPRPDFVWKETPAHNVIDVHVFERLKKLRMQPSELCSDSDFLRRAHLDLLGLLPSEDDARRFLADPAPDKRSRLIDTLLARPEFAEWWAGKWSDLLRNEEKQLDRKGVAIFYDWIRQSIAANKPLNDFAHELLASRGSTYKEPAANYYRGLREPYVRAEAMAQVFLGIRMQCAKCHNHPFNRWTQNDYHQLAAFFPRVQYKIIDNTRRDKLDKHEFNGEQMVYMDASSEVKHPVTGAILKPRLLGERTLELGEKDDRLLPLADWVARPDNPFFARTQANRIWSYLMGRGIVEPNDDFRQSNPPANGPLLDVLTRELVRSGFDQKHLIRLVMNSRTYQLSASPNATNEDDDSNYSHTIVRSLSAEALLDAINQVVGAKMTFEGHANVARAGHLPSLPTPRRGESFQGAYRFLRVFGKPERLLSCDCERSDATTLTQALTLITGDVLNQALTTADNRLGTLLKSNTAPAAIIEELYLAALSRPPTPGEKTALADLLTAAPSRRSTLEDIVWGLVNSKEFMLRK